MANKNLAFFIASSATDMPELISFIEITITTDLESNELPTPAQRYGSNVSVQTIPDTSGLLQLYITVFVINDSFVERFFQFMIEGFSNYGIRNPNRWAIKSYNISNSTKAISLNHAS